jgi:uncharacterized repeat protein (TIGR02543 family)
LTIDGDKSVSASFTLSIVTLTINQVTGGTITADPAGPYQYGDVVTLTAAADTGYTFTGWTGDCSGETSATCKLTMDGDKMVSATFAIKKYTLTVTQPEHGSISPATSIYDYGTEVELIATPAPGYHFVEWTGDCSGETSATCTLTMDADKNVSALFTQDHYKLFLPFIINNSSKSSTSALPTINELVLSASKLSFIDYSASEQKITFNSNYLPRRLNKFFLI